MVSTTATTLASNRRRLRLAQHNVRGATTATAGVGKKGTLRKAVASGRSSSPTPSPTLTVGTSASSTPTDEESTTSVTTGSSSRSGAARRRLIRHAAGDGGGGSGVTHGGGTSRQRAFSDGASLRHHRNNNGGAVHRQSQRGQQHQRTRGAAASGHGVGEGSSAGGGGHSYRRPQHFQEAQRPQPHSSEPNGGNGDGRGAATTSRGRSRRSRAATRRGGGASNEIGRVDEANEENGSNNNNNNNNNRNNESSSNIKGAQPLAAGRDAGSAPGKPTGKLAGKLELKLHVAESVDSDDNGTCFNSIGTTTPRQPSPRYAAKGANGHVVPPEAARTPDSHPNGKAATTTSGKRGGRLRARLNSGEALSPLHEARSPTATGDGQDRDEGEDPPEDVAKGGMRSRSLKKVPPEPTHFGKFGSETSGNQAKKKNGGGSRGDSIWDHPEEMIGHNVANHAISNAPNANANNGPAGRPHDKPGAEHGKQPPGDNNSNYSEFDQDGSYPGGGGGVSNAQGGGSAMGGNVPQRRGTGPSNYNQQRRGAGRGNAATHRATGNVLPGPNAAASMEVRMEDRGWFRDGGDPSAGGGGKSPLPEGLPKDGIPGENDSDDDDALLNRPNMRAALGVGAAATLGAAILGPVGLLVGAASVGIGMGVMQIPEEQRDNVRNHAATSFEKARDIACDMSDHMSSNCARYTGTDPHEVVGKVVPEEIMNCCYSGGDDGQGGGGGHFRERRGGGAGGVSGHHPHTHNRGGLGDYDGHSLAGNDYANGGGGGVGANAFEIRSEGSSPIANAVNGVERGMNRLVGDVFGDEHPSPTSQSAMGGDSRGGGGGAGGHSRSGGNGGGGGDHGVTNENEDAGRRVACGRKGRVVPLGQIHSLRPSLQPRAWLDVMASAHTTRDDKNEAMQEILILAKDKEISRWFLEEGILDSLMFILSNYFRNYSSFLRNEKPPFACEIPEPFASFKQGGHAFYHARLAANCCVALGKAHCAAVHTEGDLLLMSAYSRGSVPVERQLAQMLFEVPHHMKVMNPAHGAGGQNVNGANGEMSNDNVGGQQQLQQQFDAEFTLTELSMQQAEDLASSIKALDDGKIDV